VEDSPQRLLAGGWEGVRDTVRPSTHRLEGEGGGIYLSDKFKRSKHSNQPPSQLHRASSTLSTLDDHFPVYPLGRERDAPHTPKAGVWGASLSLTFRRHPKSSRE